MSISQSASHTPIFHQEATVHQGSDKLDVVNNQID